jgi:hypothetical protein
VEVLVVSKRELKPPAVNQSHDPETPALRVAVKSAGEEKMERRVLKLMYGEERADEILSLKREFPVGQEEEPKDVRVLTDEEVWSKGLDQKALAKCEPEDLLVGFVKDHSKYYAILYTVKPRRRYLHRLELR